MQLLSLGREAVVDDQRLPGVRVLIEAERVRPCRQGQRVLAGLLQQEGALCLGEVGRLGSCRGVLRSEVTVDLAALAGNRGLGELRRAGLAGGGGRWCGADRAGVRVTPQGGSHEHYSNQDHAEADQDLRRPGGRLGCRCGHA